LLPELEIFGWLRFHATLPGALKPDRHPAAFELHYMVRGHVTWWVENEQHDFSTAKIFVVRPNELHGGEAGSLQPCEHYWLRIRFPTKETLPGLTRPETRALRSAYENMTCRTFTASPEVKDFFERILEEHRHDASERSPLMARSMLHALLVTIVRDHHRHRHRQSAAAQPLTSWRIRHALEWLESNLFRADFRLDAVADTVGLSPAGFRARFKAETGYTPHEYMCHRRIEEARRRLAETDDDITIIAIALGFSSSQYFATVFHRAVGMTPSEFRKNRRKGESFKRKPAV